MTPNNVGGSYGQASSPPAQFSLWILPVDHSEHGEGFDTASLGLWVSGVLRVDFPVLWFSNRVRKGTEFGSIGFREGPLGPAEHLAAV